MTQSRRSFLQNLGVGAGTTAAAFSLPTLFSIKESKPVYEGKKLGFALVGLGSYAKNQVAVALEKTQYAELKGIVTGTPAKAEEWKKKYNLADKNIYNYQNFDEIVNNKDIEIVYVTMPNSLHAEYVIRAAKAGKHVITEKPMGISVKECEEMIAACKKAGVQLSVGYRLHYEPFNLEIKRLGQEKVFGAVRHIQADFGFISGDPKQWRLKKALAGGGPLMDVGIYCIQACRYVLGEEPISVTAQFGPINDKVRFSEVEESISWQFEFPSGAVSTSSSSYRANYERFFAACEKGWFELRPAYGYGPLKGATSKGEMNLPIVHHQTSHLDGVCKELLDTKSFPSHVSGEEGLKDMKLLMAIYEAARTGQKLKLV